MTTAAGRQLLRIQPEQRSPVGAAILQERIMLGACVVIAVLRFSASPVGGVGIIGAPALLRWVTCDDFEVLLVAEGGRKPLAANGIAALWRPLTSAADG